MKDSKLFNLNNINELNDDLYLPIANINSPLQFTYLGVVKEYIADGLNSQILVNSNKILELEQNISDIDLSNYLTLEENRKNELVISTALNDLLSKITTLESQLSTAMTKISVLEQELAKTLVIN